MIRVRMIFAIVPLASVTALLMISRHAWGTAGHPPGLLRKFLAIVEEKPKAAFLRAAPASVKALATKDRAKIVISDRDYSAAEKEIAELRRTGKLNDSAVNRFAVTQQIAKLTVALAQASEAPVKSIERLLSNISDVDQLVIACKASTLGDYGLDRQQPGR